MLFWFNVFSFISVILTLEQSDSKKFGPYELTWTHYEVCRGMKMRNASHTGVVVFKEDNMFYGTLDFNFTIRSSIDEAKVWIYSIKDTKKKVLWSYKIKDPCKHFVITEIIEKELNAHNCIVEKGYYNRTVNFTEITKKLLGPAFFYGNYSMKSVIAAKAANILCLVVNMEVIKK